ncbi:MAG: hypothetical protein KC619_00785 [Myxococcales bacterium]|nr:hypothetical protein [Myxococcales bacterium]
MRRAWLAVPLICLVAAAATAQRERPLSVVVYDARGVAPSALRTALEAFTAAGMEARAITPDDVRTGALDGADVVLFTGGRGSLQGQLLGEDGRARVRRFVREGHGYLGICAGAYLAIQGPEEFHKVGIVAAHNATGDRWQRGVVPTPVVPNDGSPPITLHYANGPLLARETVRGLAPYVALATFDADVYWERYDTHAGEMPGTPAVAAARYGEGRIVLFSPNPTLEPAHPDLLVRAARWVAQAGPVPPDLRWGDVFGAATR